MADTSALSVTSRLPLSHALLEAVRRHEWIGINSESEMHNSTVAVAAISGFSDNSLLNNIFLASVKPSPIVSDAYDFTLRSVISSAENKGD